MRVGRIAIDEHLYLIALLNAALGDAPPRELEWRQMIVAIAAYRGWMPQRIVDGIVQRLGTSAHAIDPQQHV